MSELDVELDEDNEKFGAWLARTTRCDIISALLAGNDTQCFTTDDYRRRYTKRWITDMRLNYELSTELAEMHLRICRDVVREVRPGVWAPTEQAGILP